MARTPAAECAAPPSGRSSRFTDVTTTCWRLINGTDLATFSGSCASSQPRGLPVSTAQNRQARVHTDPISMMVAVPAFQHSPMFGHFASSHTVLRRCSRTMLFTAPKAAPVANGARSQCGLGGFSAAACDCLMPSLMAVKPWAVVYFSPLRVAIPAILLYLARVKSRLLRLCKGGVLWGRA